MLAVDARLGVGAQMLRPVPFFTPLMFDRVHHVGPAMFRPLRDPAVSASRRGPRRGRWKRGLRAAPRASAPRRCRRPSRHRFEGRRVGNRQHRRIGRRISAACGQTGGRRFVVSIVSSPEPPTRASPRPAGAPSPFRSRRRHHLHNVEALRLELLEQARQRRDRFRMNVVQQQDALAALVQAAHGERNDLCRRDVAVPVVGHHVGGKDDQPALGKFALEQVGAFEAGDAEERREISQSPPNAALTSAIPPSISWCIRSSGNLPKPIG